jgi:hypothetical protein
LRQRAAALVLTLTSASSWTVFVWLLLIAAVVGLWYGIQEVSKAHNATLTWATGISLAVLFIGCFVPASSRGTSTALRGGTTVVAIVDRLVYAFKVGERVQGVPRAEVKSARWLFGVTAIASRSRGGWLIVPSNLFPTRAQWRKLTGRVKRPTRSLSESTDDDVPKWGG